MAVLALIQHGFGTRFCHKAKGRQALSKIHMWGMLSISPPHQCLPGFFFNNVLPQFRHLHEKRFFPEVRKFAKHQFENLHVPFYLFSINCEERMEASSILALSCTIVSWSFVLLLQQPNHRWNLRVLNYCAFLKMSSVVQKSLGFLRFVSFCLFPLMSSA